jgi:hypothetical protein
MLTPDRGRLVLRLRGLATGLATPSRRQVPVEHLDWLAEHARQALHVAGKELCRASEQPAKTTLVPPEPAGKLGNAATVSYDVSSDALVKGSHVQTVQKMSTSDNRWRDVWTKDVQLP